MECTPDTLDWQCGVLPLLLALPRCTDAANKHYHDNHAAGIATCNVGAREVSAMALTVTLIAPLE